MHDKEQEKDSQLCHSKECMSRRDFLDQLIRFGVLTTLAGMVYPALNYLWPVTRQGPAGGLNDIGPAEEIPLWNSKKVIIGGSAVLVIHTSSGFKAFSAICTHLGCLVGWDDKGHKIVCPCHAGVYDLDGKVVAGPPPKALPTYEVSVAQGRIMVKV